MSSVHHLVLHHKNINKHLTTIDKTKVTRNYFDSDKIGYEKGRIVQP